MDYRKTAAERIKYYRKLCGMNQEELGDAVGISCKHISTLENGEATMGIDTLMKVCEAFGVTPNDILLEPEESEEAGADGTAGGSAGGAAAGKTGSGKKRKLTQAEKLIVARMQLKQLCCMLSDETEE